MDVRILKLVSGEEVITEVLEEDNQMLIKNPLTVAIVRGSNGQPNVGFAPFPIHAEEEKDRTMWIQFQHIVYSYVPAQDFVNNYNSIFGTGIVLPKQPQIITG